MSEIEPTLISVTVSVLIASDFIILNLLTAFSKRATNWANNSQKLTSITQCVKGISRQRPEISWRIRLTLTVMPFSPPMD
jgi:hypothetical protein